MKNILRHIILLIISFLLLMTQACTLLSPGGNQIPEGGSPGQNSEGGTVSLPGSIKGAVYCDEDADGECGCEEKGLSGIKIRLYSGDCGDDLYQTTLTDVEGKFSYTGLPAGEYCVFADLEPVCGGYLETTGMMRTVVLDPGESEEVSGFGFTYFR